MNKVETTRYVAVTAIGKPLFIHVEQKAIGSGLSKNTYSLTDDLVVASKTLNKTSADTMIRDYIAATQSNKTFEIVSVHTTFELEGKDEDCCD